MPVEEPPHGREATLAAEELGQVGERRSGAVERLHDVEDLAGQTRRQAGAWLFPSVDARDADPEEEGHVLLAQASALAKLTDAVVRDHALRISYDQSSDHPDDLHSERPGAEPLTSQTSNQVLGRAERCRSVPYNYP